MQKKKKSKGQRAKQGKARERLIRELKYRQEEHTTQHQQRRRQ